MTNIYKLIAILQGRLFPHKAMMHFLLFQIYPPISEKNSDSVENFSSFTFSRQISRFSYANISDGLLFFSHRSQFISLPFSLFQYLSPYFARTIISPYFLKFPPVFVKFTCFLHTLYVFRFPLLLPLCIYASHNARTGGID